MKRGFAESLAMGNRFSAWIRDRLIEDMWVVIPLEDNPAVNGRGPTTAGADGITLPDHQAMKRGHVVAVEAKLKSKVTWGRMVQDWEHGIDQSDYDGYQRYEQHTGIPVFLVLGEADTHDVYGARLKHLGVHLSHSGGMPPMAYWPRQQMQSDWLLMLNRHVTRSDWRDARRARQMEIGE